MCRVSQFEIEKIVEEIFPTTGTFVEIGCWDGKHISNTYYLEKEKGWNGVCVDPFPKNFETRRAILVKRAVCEGNQPREFLRVYTDKRDGGDVSYFSGFKDSVKAHLELIEKYCAYETIMVDTIPVNDVLQKVGRYIELLSVDTEGSELEILLSIDYSRFEFGLIAVEHNQDEFHKWNVRKLMEKHNYVLYKSLVIDDIFINKKLIK